MNYLLHYNNAAPIFIGGCLHGQMKRVPLSFCRGQQFKVPKLGELNYRMEERPYLASDIIRTDSYRVEEFVASGRVFRIMVHEVLSADAALMLMLSTVGESSEMLARIKHLEHENAELRARLRQAQWGKG